MTGALVPRPRRIWLIGSMGAGKTAVGRALADLLGWPLLDNDTELEGRTGRTAVDLAACGPDALHAAESDELRAAAVGPVPAVVGVAAGVGERPDDLELLRRTGVVVYLRARVETLARRVGGGEGRPWLSAGAAEFLAARLAERGTAYESWSDVVIDVDEQTPEEAAGEIVRLLPGQA